MRRLHVGVGAQRGALTVFPIWGEFAAVPTHLPAAEQVTVGELATGATVNKLEVTNTGAAPVILFQGQVVEGGLQHRMIAQPTVVAARARDTVDVVCVEQGRWSGGQEHRTFGRRASGRVRAGLSAPAAQEEVWQRVATYERIDGATGTQSWVAHADRRADRVDNLIRGLAPLPGQIGVALGIAGQPFAIEVFDCHDTLLNQYDAVLRAAAFDAIGMAPVATPARRVQRLVIRAAQVRQGPPSLAGLGRVQQGRNQYADLATLHWNSQEAHIAVTNVRHELYTLTA